MSDSITVVGGGCTGPLMALLLARRGFEVDIFERRPDVRLEQSARGRSINLALAARGLNALTHAEMIDQVRPLLMPMRGREIHLLDGTRQFLPYSQHPDELIWSVERGALNRTLTLAAEASGARFHFEHALTQVDVDTGRMHFKNLANDDTLERPLHRVIAADGAHSMIRAAMTRAGRASSREDVLPHRYKELTIPPDVLGLPRLRADALHIWPRGGYMLIALPNPNGSFTATLFMSASDSQPNFTQLDSASAIDGFFAEQFPDAHVLMDDLVMEFQRHPEGLMSTIHVDHWHLGEKALLIGDAAHAIVPFHGQGMNCGFEDCRVLAELLDGGTDTPTDWGRVFEQFEILRRDNAAAIARMALENYIEMRDTVRDPRFSLKKELALELERRKPTQFIPRYSMVSFRADIPYAVAEQRGALQNELMDAALAGHDSIDALDWPMIEAAVDRRLPPINASRNERS